MARSEPKSVSIFSVRHLIHASLWALATAFACNVLAADFIYTVRPGDHPWNVAQRYLKNTALSTRLLQLNQIPDEHRLMPGSRLRIPHEWLKLETAHVQMLAAYGDTLLTTGSNAYRPAVTGETLMAPLTLRTGPSGSATLEFSDGSRVLVRRDTEVRLLKAQKTLLGQANWVSLMLAYGHLENQVTPVSDTGGRFEIRSAAAVAAVRGTAFRLQADAATLRTEVLEGAVHVANPTGQANVAAGQGSVALGGQTPGLPVALLPAPSLEGVPQRIERLPIDLSMPALAGATAYRTQLATDASFRTLVSDESGVSPRVRARDVEDGNYVLRVRAVDAHGLEGFSAQRALVVHARPEPPILMEPAPDSVTDVARPHFKWTRAGAGLHYRLQIVGGADQQPVHEWVVASDTDVRPPKDLLAGTYRWRVASIHPTLGQGPWGDIQGFRRVLPGPGVDAPQLQDGAYHLRWSGQPQTSSYRLQLSRDAAFGALLADVKTPVAQYRADGLTPGTHHVRVQAIGSDGYAGPWGSVQTFVVPEHPPRYEWLWLLLPLLGLL